MLDFLSKPYYLLTPLDTLKMAALLIGALYLTLGAWSGWKSARCWWKGRFDG